VNLRVAREVLKQLVNDVVVLPQVLWEFNAVELEVGLEVLLRYSSTERDDHHVFVICHHTMDIIIGMNVLVNLVAKLGNDIELSELRAARVDAGKVIVDLV